jgi:hypothetical protein
MKLVDLLGRKLKDESVLQLFEDHEVGDVVYSFDRLREGTEDAYSAKAEAAGFELMFNHDQVLETAFCHVSSVDGFMPVDVAVAGVPLFTSPEEAESAAKAVGTRYSTGQAKVALLGLKTSWVRHERAEAWVHYEFRDGALALVTLSRPRS